MGAKVLYHRTTETAVRQNESIAAKAQLPHQAILRRRIQRNPCHAPFDRILITAAAPSIPNALLTQLKVGGIMVLPVGDDIQVMYRLRKISETEIISEEHGTFRFVPMLTDRASDL
jgi:protein-L-isoaspartate O-methyltransferase